MNLTLKLKLQNIKTKVDGMFKEMPWYLGSDLYLQDKDVKVLIFINSNFVDSNVLVHRINQVKVDKVPLSGVLKTP